MEYVNIKKTPFLCAVFSLVLMSSHLNAETYPQEIYTVQVGAYKNLSNSVINQLEAFGDVKTNNKASLTLVSVGNLTDKTEARLLLGQLRDEGFSDAFIRKAASSQISSVSDIKLTPTSNSASAISESQFNKLESLSADDRPYAVFLDGDVYLKKGDQFIPVD